MIRMLYGAGLNSIQVEEQKGYRLLFRFQKCESRDRLQFPGHGFLFVVVQKWLTKGNQGHFPY